MDKMSIESGAAGQHPKLWGIFLDSPITKLSIEPYSEESGLSCIQLQVEDPDGQKYFLKVTYGKVTSDVGAGIDAAPQNDVTERMIGRTIRELLNLPSIL